MSVAPLIIQQIPTKSSMKRQGNKLMPKGLSLLLKRTKCVLMSQFHFSKLS